MDGRKLGKYQVDDILTKIEEGMDADSIVEFYQSAVVGIVMETGTFIDFYSNEKVDALRNSPVIELEFFGGG